MNNRKNKKVISRLIIVASIVIAVLFVFGIIREYLNRVELDNEITELESELVELKLDKKDFLQSIEAYQTDFYVEQEAREKFNLIKQGEKVAVIPIDQINTKDTNLNNEKNTVDLKSVSRSNAIDWWQYFFGDKVIN
jgi:cell division protein FtsB